MVVGFSAWKICVNSTTKSEDVPVAKLRNQNTFFFNRLPVLFASHQTLNWPLFHKITLFLFYYTSLVVYLIQGLVDFSEPGLSWIFKAVSVTSVSRILQIQLGNLGYCSGANQTRAITKNK
jgi:hypothetical protein